VQLPIFVGSLAFGMALGLNLPHEAFAWTAGTVILLAVAFAARRHGFIAAILLLIAGGLYGSMRAISPVGGPIGAALSVAKPVQGAGHVDIVELRDGRGPRLVLSSVALQGAARAGRDERIELYISHGTTPVLPGDSVSFRVLLEGPRGFANPGATDGRLSAATRGIVARGHLSSATELRIVAHGGSFGPRRIAHQARQAMRRELERALSAPVALFMRTAVLGERAASGADVEAGFKAAGATHALSVSGLHLAAVAAVLFLFVRRLFGLSAWLSLRASPSLLAAFLCIPAVIFYTLVTGEAIATWRSALMASVVFGASVVNRKFSLAHGVALAALLVLLDSPLWLLDPSFQLSFVSVIALGLFSRAFSPQVAADEPASGLWYASRRWLLSALGATTAAGLCTTPLVAHHFGEITPAAFLGNLVLTPQVELLIVPLGLFGAVLSLIHPILGWLPLSLAEYATRLALFTAEAFANHAPIWRCRYPNPFETACLTIGVACALMAFRAARQNADPRRIRRWCKVAGVWLAVAMLSLSYRELSRRFSTEVEITFIDVGQGDAALVLGPRGFVMLVDGGGLPGSDYDVGKRIVEPLLRRKGIARIDLAVLSHAHPDHMLGLVHVLERFEITTLWAAVAPGESGIFDAMAKRGLEKGMQMPVPQALSRDGLSLEPLGPVLSSPDGKGGWNDAIGRPDGLGANDASLSVRLSYAGRSVLFSGDVESAGETELCGRDRAGLLGKVGLHADLLKVPHHGSRTSSSAEFLDAVAPSIAIISDGVNNRFGFPHAEVLERYQARPIRMLRTDQSGAITIRIGPSGKIDATCVLGCR
jgi:competence protein ComEC